MFVRGRRGVDDVRMRIIILTLTLLAGHAHQACTRPLPDKASYAAWVSVDGHDVQSASSGGNSMYFADRGAMVELSSYKHNGPVCARGITWRQRVHVRIKLLKLS